MASRQSLLSLQHPLHKCAVLGKMSASEWPTSQSVTICCLKVPFGVGRTRLHGLVVSNRHYLMVQREQFGDDLNDGKGDWRRRD